MFYLSQPIAGLLLVTSQLFSGRVTSKPAGVTGGTMHPMYRKVKIEDINELNLHRLDFNDGKAVLGEFTNVWHNDHANISPEDFFGSPIG